VIFSRCHEPGIRQITPLRVTRGVTCQCGVIDRGTDPRHWKRIARHSLRGSLGRRGGSVSVAINGRTRIYGFKVIFRELI
jgi:hypothetical protein